MAETQETIIAEMRDLAANRDWHNHTGQSNRERVLYLADRLEAALKRERGDCAKLREAIMEIRRAMMKDSGAGPATELHATIDAITQAALAAPVKNCEVGTAEEQWRRFCDIEAPTCRAEDVCHCRTAARCFADWSQRPYKEGGAK